MSEEIKEILDDYKKLSGEITEKLDNTAEYESWLIIQDYVDEFLNYITNLQKENEELQRKYLTINENNQNMQEEMIRTWKKCDDYKSRNEKAVEYIEKYLHEHVIDEYPDEQSTFYDEKDRFIPNAKEVLLNILKGED